jgi:hypothetical protein
MPLDAQQVAKLKSEVHLGMEIAALVENSTVKTALNGLLHGLQNEWMVTITPEGRELLWQKAQGVQEFVGALRTIVDTGKMAASQLATDAALRGQDDEN